MSKLINIGFVGILNEEKLIRGWARLMLHFCKRVVALVDPITDDKTLEILKREFPTIEIEWQDRSLGDSTYWDAGPTRACISHGNHTKFMQENVEDGEWVCMLAADERYSPSDIQLLDVEIQRAREMFRSDGIVHRRMLEFLYDDNHFVKYNKNCVTQVRFFRKHASWAQLPKAHEGNAWFPRRPFISLVPFYHFPVARGRKRMESWHYTEVGNYKVMKERNNGQVPVEEYTGELFEWKDMSEL